MCETKSFKLWLLQIVGLLGFLALIVWLALIPRKPRYAIQNISIPQLNNCASSLADDGCSTVQYEIEISNPNKDSGVYYDDILLTFYHVQAIVGNDKILSFYQGTNRKKQVQSHVDANPQVWKALRNAILNATALIRVDLSTGIKYKTWGIKSKHHEMHMEGNVPIGKDGKISGKKKKIKLRPSKKLKLTVSHFLGKD